MGDQKYLDKAIENILGCTDKKKMNNRSKRSIYIHELAKSDRLHLHAADGAAFVVQISYSHFPELVPSFL